MHGWLEEFADEVVLAHPTPYSGPLTPAAVSQDRAAAQSKPGFGRAMSR